MIIEDLSFGTILSLSSLSLSPFPPLSHESHTLPSMLLHHLLRRTTARAIHTDVGLEFHIQLSTPTKLFSPSHTTPPSTTPIPNTHVSATDAGLPGALPLLSTPAVSAALSLGLALSGHIATTSVFDRKHYFYPDMPTGYQITQRLVPYLTSGWLPLSPDPGHGVPILYASLEQDSGKLSVSRDPSSSLLDLNRAGMPLVEVVTSPDLHSPRDAQDAVRSIQRLVRAIGISSGNLEDGSLRVDVNVSVRPDPSSPLGTRTEVKNLNSIKAVGRAISHEVSRQSTALAQGKSLSMETRAYDARSSTTTRLRAKESQTDYRFLPDPDLPPLIISQAAISKASASLPELPFATMARLEAQTGLPRASSERLSQLPNGMAYFESVLSHTPNSPNSPLNPKTVADFILNEIYGRVHPQATIDSFPIAPPVLARILSLVEDDTLSRKAARSLFLSLLRDATSQNAILTDPTTVDSTVQDLGLAQLPLEQVESFISTVIQNNPSAVADFNAGKKRALGFLIAQVMKLSKGKAPPGVVSERLRSLISSGNDP